MDDAVEGQRLKGESSRGHVAGEPSAPSDPVAETTRLLAAWRGGDTASLPRLAEILHHQLRQQARAQLRRLRPGETLGTTALVNEAFLKLVHQRAANDRSHFFAVAATAMRHILVDHARSKRTQKRGEGQQNLELADELFIAAGGQGTVEQQAVSLLDLHGALERLADSQPRQARVVECRFFGGMTEPQIAEALGVTDRTVRRDWIKARAWLYRQLADHGPETTPDQEEVSPLSKSSPKTPSSA